VQDLANYTSDNSFSIDGVSSDTYGIWVDTFEPIPKAKRRVTTYFTGEDEGNAIPDEVYEFITFSIRFYKFFPDGYDDSPLYLFLNSGNTLQLSCLSDYYFKIIAIDLVQVGQIADAKRFDYVATFTLVPFKYGVSNDWITVSNGDTVVNSGNRFSKPLIEITGASGDITIGVNDDRYKINGASGTVYIDSSRFILYDDNNQLITGKDEGKLPQLAVGNNTITWTGTLSTFKIKTNWRKY
jgi:phage-related protein